MELAPTLYSRYCLAFTATVSMTTPAHCTISESDTAATALGAADGVASRNKGGLPRTRLNFDKVIGEMLLKTKG